MTTKEKIICILSEKIGSLVSGESLAKECGISRAAIWKAITCLRQEGFSIEGTTNGGYLLSKPTDLFSQNIFSSELSKTYPQYSKNYIECFKQIDSTNTYAKRVLTECGPMRDSQENLTQAGIKYHKSIYIAECQSAGRGRLGRTFYSPSKTGIYISIIYAPKNGITEPAKLTAFSAVAVCRAIQKLYKIQPSIKWINDIFINQKKVCGILTEGFMNFETQKIESAIIGIGVNIQNNSEEFPEDVKKIVGGIVENLENNFVTRAQFASEIVGQVLSILDEDLEGLNFCKDVNARVNSTCKDNIIEEYKSLSFLLGKTIDVHPIIGDDKSVYKAKAVDVDQNASLIVQLEDGSFKTLNSGEVSIHSEQLANKM